MARKPPQSGYYGVYPHKESRTFYARIHNPLLRKAIFLGTFPTAKRAAAAVRSACKHLGKVPYKTRAKQTVCQWGHPLVEENRMKDGRCKKCYLAYSSAYYYRRRKSRDGRTETD